MGLKITDGRGRRQENLGGVEVLTSGGVPPAWAALLEQLPAEGRVLDYGSWQGLGALWLRVAAPAVRAEFAQSSAFRLAQARANAEASAISLAATPLFPIAGTWDTILLTAPEQNEALHMMARQGAASLAPGGRLLLVDSQNRGQVLEHSFGLVEKIVAGKDWVIQCCRVPKDSAAYLPWQKVLVSIRGLELELESLPGNFSPRALDEGTRGLLDNAQIPPGGRVLDLGCGYGPVGITAALLGAGEVVFADDCLAALTATRRNLEKLGLRGELVHCHRPTAIPGKFACILTNPPYHVDYGLAKSFVEFASRRLESGGWLYLVVKKPDWYREKLTSALGGCRVISAGEYRVLAAQKRPGWEGGSPQGPRATRKHQRRQQAAGERRKRYGPRGKISGLGTGK